MKIEFDKKDKNFPFVATSLLYLTELVLYLTGFISGTLFLNFLLLMSVLFLIFLFIIRKKRVEKRAFVFSAILSLLLLIYESPLILIDEKVYLVTSYSDPLELIKGANIYMLSVNVFQISGVENEQEVRDMFIYSQGVYDIIPGKNYMIYGSKNTAIFEYIGLYKSEFEKSFENVTAYLNTSNTEIDEFYSQDNSDGGSAGLAIVLSSFSKNGKLQNNVPIAVTGAISKTGEVKKVGGMKEKIQIANENDFSYMIVPKANLAEANEVKGTLNLPIEIIGVTDVDETIQLINDLNRVESNKI
ncbi:S16 family serine protease [Litchfieldia salsa]|uniref:Lon protease (S16) C-terminal proteolytic domain-containing protein n=1 Tax=Litchfieldia salsa TaxID=930152 RepID=A0A1H0Q3L0_9BACI|nr:S16 family serine protease [Litchfieldia salsa]SDP11286.1 Lon protease (S16) C-terminal proteolytic domain-containing protein [Litchfieldia salsa]